MCLGFEPLGSDQVDSFTGIFDGNGHVIRNLYINRTENYIGLFGCTRGADIENVRIADSTIQGFYQSGSLVGYASNATTVKNCGFETGMVTGERYVGGLVGLKDSTSSIESSYSDADVTGNSYVGGLIGATGTKEQGSISYFIPQIL